MKTINKFPSLAVTFGLISILTSYTLFFGSVQWLNWVLGLFWFVTGLLGLYVAFRR